MENGMEIIGTVLMAAITFPLAFVIARACLRGVLRVVAAPGENSPRLAR